MTVGIPGTGIGGLFYLVSAATIPLRELLRRVRGRPPLAAPGLVRRQVAMVAGIAGGLWLTGWILAALIVRSTSTVRATGLPPGPGAENVLQVASVLLGFVTLVLVLAVVEVARLVVRGRAARPRRVVRMPQKPRERVPSPRAA